MKIERGKRAKIAVIDVDKVIFKTVDGVTVLEIKTEDMLTGVIAERDPEAEKAFRHAMEAIQNVPRFKQEYKSIWEKDPS